MNEPKMESAEAVQVVDVDKSGDHLERAPNAQPAIPDLTEDQQTIDKKILRKIDLLILPLCALNYFFSSMERADIGNAKIAGFQKDNHLTATQFSTVISLFYVGYIICQPIGSLAIRHVETYLLLGMANIAWGIMTIMLMFSDGLVLPGILRVFIGAAEGLTQINNVFLTMWYTQHEIATRTGIWYSSGVLAGSFNGIIAFSSSSRGYCPSSPEKVKKFFTEEEKELCVARTQRARNTAGARISISGMLTIFRSPETYAMWLAYFCVIWSSSGYGNFLPSLVNGLGFDPVISQLLTVPICFIGFLSVNFWCWFSDRLQIRGPLIIGLALTCTAGFSILAGVAEGKGPRMFALCLISFSVQPLIPLTLAFLFTNTVGLSRRALSIPLQNACGQFGGLAVTYTFTDAPRYFKGTLATIGCLTALSVIIASLDMYFMLQNRRKQSLKGTEQYKADALKSFDELGTNHPDFAFTL